MLRDPARRKIIEMLGEQGKIGFKDLRNSLGLGVGTVYYHLDMLSDFIIQDKGRKYALNDRGQLLYRSLKEGNVSPALRIGSEALGHRLGRWLFLSPIFARTNRLELSLPVAAAVLFVGAIGAALAKLEPIFFFYFPSNRGFESVAAIFIFYWVGVFLLGEVIVTVMFRRMGGNLQLLACLGLSAFPLTIFPFIYLVIPPDYSWLSRYVLLVLQVWTLLLLSSAFSFGKGLRLDRSIIVTLMILYLNIVVLLLLGRLV